MIILLSMLLAIGTVMLTIMLGILLPVVIVLAVGWLGDRIPFFKKQRQDSIRSSTTL